MLHTARTSSNGGHTHRNPRPMTVSDPRSATSPATVRNTAGAAAQRCGRSLTRTDRIASNAQPTAKPSSTTPVSTSARAGMNRAVTSATTTTSPAAIDAATIKAMRPLDEG